MPTEIEQRYQQYLDYIQITTARMARHSGERPRGLSLRLTAPSPAEFMEWWNRISVEPATLERWSQRLDAPDEFFEQTRIAVRMCLESLPLARAA